MGRPIRVVNVTSSLTGGGSGTATRRINDCLNENGLSSSLFLARPEMESLVSREGVTTRLRRVESKVRYRLSTAVGSVFGQKDGLDRSLAFIDSFRVNELNRIDADIISLHWTQGGFLSVRDISRIQKPIVWTLHDSWLFCGAEHHPNYSVSSRYKEGYRRLERREEGKIWVDIDRWCWNRKMKQLQNINHVIAPSTWMQSRAEEAQLLKGKKVYRIPHPLDKDCFFREDSFYARQRLSLPLDKQIILFGGANPWNDKNKGWDLFRDSLMMSDLDRETVAIVTFGANNESCGSVSGYQHISLAYIESESELRALYSSGDLLVVPSKVESFGLIAAEAQMCGLPTVAFEGSGLSDVIEDGRSGRLLGERDARSLAACMSSLLREKEILQRMGHQAIASAQNKWNYEVIASKYKEVFLAILDDSSSESLG